MSNSRMIEFKQDELALLTMVKSHMAIDDDNIKLREKYLATGNAHNQVASLLEEISTALAECAVLLNPDKRLDNVDALQKLLNEMLIPKTKEVVFARNYQKANRLTTLPSFQLQADRVNIAYEELKEKMKELQLKWSYEEMQIFKKHLSTFLKIKESTQQYLDKEFNGFYSAFYETEKSFDARIKNYQSKINRIYAAIITLRDAKNEAAKSVEASTSSSSEQVTTREASTPSSSEQAPLPRAPTATTSTTQSTVVASSNRIYTASNSAALFSSPQTRVRIMQPLPVATVPAPPTQDTTERLTPPRTEIAASTASTFVRKGKPLVRQVLVVPTANVNGGGKTRRCNIL